jgi:hypothetical protein
MEIFRRALFSVQRTDAVSTLTDWEYLEEQFSSVALLEYMIHKIPNLSDAFALWVNYKVNCSNCGYSFEKSSIQHHIAGNAPRDFGFVDGESPEHTTIATFAPYSCGYNACTAYMKRLHHSHLIFV